MHSRCRLQQCLNAKSLISESKRKEQLKKLLSLVQTQKSSSYIFLIFSHFLMFPIWNTNTHSHMSVLLDRATKRKFKSFWVDVRSRKEKGFLSFSTLLLSYPSTFLSHSDGERTTQWGYEWVGKWKNRKNYCCHCPKHPLEFSYWWSSRV